MCISGNICEGESEAHEEVKELVRPWLCEPLTSKELAPHTLNPVSRGLWVFPGAPLPWARGPPLLEGTSVKEGQPGTAVGCSSSWGMDKPHQPHTHAHAHAHAHTRTRSKVRWMCVWTQVSPDPGGGLSSTQGRLFEPTAWAGGLKSEGFKESAPYLIGFP